MTIRGSRKLSSLGGYAFAEVDKLVEELKAKGASVLDFGVGDPRAPTPSLVRGRGKTAIDEHATSGYPSYVGSASFRKAAADWIGRRFGVTLDPAEHVTATIGSKEAVFHLPLAFVDPGDVVVSPNPGYPPYARGTLFAGGTKRRRPDWRRDKLENAGYGAPAPIEQQATTIAFFGPGHGFNRRFARR